MIVLCPRTGKRELALAPSCSYAQHVRYLGAMIRAAYVQVRAREIRP